MIEKSSHNENDSIEVELKEPVLAALLAWLLPGAGHIYQGRLRKGALFMVCILGTFFFGLILGNGHVVYAAWRPNDYRWQTIPQLGTGIVAFPAILQNFKTREGGEPFLITGRRYPPGHAKQFELMSPDEYDRFEGISLPDGFMAPPAGELYLNDPDVLAAWTSESRFGFELGTLYTIIAGLLNVLAIYDAFAGPVLPSRSSGSSGGEDPAEDQGNEKGRGGKNPGRRKDDDQSKMDSNPKSKRKKRIS
ncbi:MAG: hypothetical protein P8M80_12290 [Pirellulaceae bacterium]|nr:hypothetical protein [Pirellulaceae bacterium]